MRQFFLIFSLLSTCILSYGQNNQWVWSNGQLVYGMPVASIDSLTYNDQGGVDTLLLPRKWVHIVYDTILVRDTVFTHDTVYTVTTDMGVGAHYYGDNFANSNQEFEAIITIDKGYKIAENDVEVTMGNYLLSNGITIIDNLVKVVVSKVSGNISIKVRTHEETTSTNVKTDLTSLNATFASSIEIVNPNQKIGHPISYIEAGTRGVYTWDIPSESIVSVTVVGGGSYGMALTDNDGKVVEFFTNDMVAADASTRGTYTYAPQTYATKLHVSSAKFVSASYNTMTKEQLNGMSFAITSDSTISGHYVAPSQTIGSEVKYNQMNSTNILISNIIPANCYVTVSVKSGGSYGFAICDTAGMVLEAQKNSDAGDSLVLTFDTHTVETRLHASLTKYVKASYTYNDTTLENTGNGQQNESNTNLGSINNYWAGKTIWWCGTSIPAGKYPELVGDMLGATMINTSVGGSMCRANVRTGDYNGANISNITSALTMTKEEAEAFIANYSTLCQLDKNTSWPSSLDASYEKRIREGSFEDKLLPYLDGTKQMPDLWIIDHSHNDWKYKDSKGNIDITLKPTRANINSGELAEDIYMTANNYQNLIKYVGKLDNIDPNKLDDFVCSLNRNCYYGALNFLVTVILVHNPRARFMVIGNYSNETSGETTYAKLIDAQKWWAADWCFPFCDIASNLGTSQHIIPGTKEFDSENHSTKFDYDIPVFRVYCPDGVHPSSDNSQYSLNIYAGILSEFIKSHR